MHDEIVIGLTNKSHLGVIEYTFLHLERILPLKESKALHEALNELLNNVIEHAYLDERRINLNVRFVIEPRQIRIDVEDDGLPFDFSRFMHEPLDQSKGHDKGFYRVYDLVDRFWFTMLPNAGKRFSIIQSFTHSYDTKKGKKLDEVTNKAYVLKHLKIRSFKEGDGDGIAKLIYKNYHYTYYKTHFYQPEKIRKLNEKKDIHSIVADFNGAIVGHFALVFSPQSNIAEIAIAAVDPHYKKMGIMNKMFDYLIAKAEELALLAIYGEAIMMHPYSQKANLAHGMIETAILLGEVPSKTEIEHHIKIQQRSGALVSYLVFDKHPRFIEHSGRYHDKIEKVYHDMGIKLLKVRETVDTSSREAIDFHINKIINIAIIKIEKSIEKSTLKAVLETINKAHSEMIYADINLHHIKELDALVKMLNKHRFFYSGVLIAYYDNEDYLRMQCKNSHFVAEEQLVCYSTNAKKMLDFIRKDEKDISTLF